MIRPNVRKNCLPSPNSVHCLDENSEFIFFSSKRHTLLAKDPVHCLDDNSEFFFFCQKDIYGGKIHLIANKFTLLPDELYKMGLVATKPVFGV